MPYLDIILYVSVIAFFALRLYAMLGKRIGHQEPRGSGKPSAAPATQDAPDTAQTGPQPFTGPAAAGMEAIRAADGRFDPDTFIDGAKKAYGMIITAYADGDRTALRPLLADPVFAKYDAAIGKRETAKQTQKSELIRIVTAEIDEAELDEEDAVVTVRFVAEIASAVLDEAGETVEGDMSRIRRSSELWTFTRHVRSKDPIWRLARVRPGS